MHHYCSRLHIIDDTLKYLDRQSQDMHREFITIRCSWTSEARLSIAMPSSKIFQPDALISEPFVLIHKVSIMPVPQMLGAMLTFTPFPFPSKKSMAESQALWLPVNSLFTACTSLSRASALHKGSMKNGANLSKAPRKWAGLTSKW